MKILINIINAEQIAEIQETSPNFGGTFNISGYSFIPYEWIHVPDKFVIPDNRKLFIKPVRGVLAAMARRYLREYNLHQFAQGVKDGALQYGEAVPVLAETILALAPDEEIAE